MILTAATDNDVGRIVFTLAEARKRPRSEDFLNGFPWTSVCWYTVEALGIAELEQLFLFWDGSAWGESVARPPRRLRQGAEDFARVAGDIRTPNIDHLVDILRHRDRYRTGAWTDETFLIAIGHNEHSPLMILDGNHRAVAALWCAMESGQQAHLPHTAWLGLSSNMANCYPPYQHIFQALT